MPKKTKNRSSKQTRYAHQARARAARQEVLITALIQATQTEFPAALASGAFSILTEDGALKVSLEEMRQRVNAGLANDGEPPLDGLNELKDMLTDDVTEGHIVCLPNGLWRFPEAYLPKAGQE